MSSAVLPGTFSRWWALGVLSSTVLCSWTERAAMTFALPWIARTFDWSVSEVGARGGLLFSVFFVGYGLSLIACSGLAQRLGPMRSLVAVVLCSSTVTMASGIGAATIGKTSFPLIVGLRFALGITEGVHIPMIATLVREWFPLAERARANAFFVGATLMANLIAPWAVLPATQQFGWQITIALVGAVSLLPLPLLMNVARQPPRPAQNAVVDSLLHETTNEQTRISRAVFPSLMVLGVCSNLCAYSLFSWLPAYLDHLGHGMVAARLASTMMIPNVACIVALIVLAWIGDRVGHKFLISAAGFAMLAVCLCMASRSDGIASAVSLSSLALVGLVAYTAQETALIQRVWPVASVGKALGWYNGVGMLVGGSAGTYAFGQLVSWSSRFDFALLALVPVAVVAAAVCLTMTKRLTY